MKVTLMEITDGSGKRIRRIPGDTLPEAEERDDHFLHLLFGSLTVTDNRQFDLGRSELVNGDIVLGCGQKGNAPGLPQFERTLWIASEKNLF